MLTFALLAGPAAAAVHPFYAEAMRSGRQAYEQGDFKEAIRQLEVASFGMLEDVPVLTEALTHLALAQAAARQREDFLATYERIGALEEDFGGYTSSPMPAELKRQFEARVLEWVPAPMLQQSRAFARLYREQELERLRQMLPGARARALAELVEREPDDPTWPLMLATARVESGSGAEALEALETFASERPGSPRISCLLGRARLQAGACEAILAEPLETIHRCDLRRLPEDELVPYLDCLTKAERWLEAARVVVSLPPERRKSRPFPNWEKRIARRIEPGVEVEVLPPFEPDASDTEDAADRVATMESPDSLVKPAPPMGAASATSPPARPERELGALRQRLTRARSVEELESVTQAAAAMSQRFPEASREFLYIAGEAAYRASNWRLAADYLGRAGGPSGKRHDLLFYLSVALYELGEVDRARPLLNRALPGLERTPLVERYEQLILGSGT